MTKAEVIMIGTICKLINVRVPKNNGIRVVITGDAGKRYINTLGTTQCWFMDRELQTVNGKWRNWISEKQLQPIEPEKQNARSEEMELIK